MCEQEQRRSGFLPRYRNDVEVNYVERKLPEGKEPTRVHGAIIFVSAKEPNEGYRGGSAYTDRQLKEITEYLAEKAKRHSLAKELTERQIRVIAAFSRFQKTLKKTAPAVDIFGEVVYIAKPKGGK